MISVPEVGRAACQLSPAAIFAMVVGQGAIVHHHRDVREHTLRPRHQLLHGQPNLWEAVGAPIPGGPFCAKTRETSWSPPLRPTAQPFLSCQRQKAEAYLCGLIVGICVQEDG